jgi:hypothetical protein
MENEIPENLSPAESATRLRNHLARMVLAAFIFTFILARILVIFIMAGKLPPELFFHVKGTHVHHLNYGIFLLSFTGAALLFAQPKGIWLTLVAIIYGIGLGLTFDEFGMWLHLGGLYWQRASYDAVVTVASLLALIAYGSTIRKWRPRHFITLIVLIGALVTFGIILKKSLTWAQHDFGPRLYELEVSGPS